HKLAHTTVHGALDAAVVARWKELTMTQDERGERHVHRKRWLDPMPDPPRGGAHRKVRMCGQEGSLLSRRRLEAGGSRDSRRLASVQRRRSRVPHALQHGSPRARSHFGTLGQDGCEPCEWRYAARLGVAA